VQTIEIDRERENECRGELHAHLHRSGQTNVEANVSNLMSLEGGMRDRLEFFLSRVPAGPRTRLLVSGCSVGTEMVLGRILGFAQVHGTEVDRTLARLASARIRSEGAMHLTYIGPGLLPYRDGVFSAVLSSHVIEHTPEPRTYLAEHLRVIEPGGHLFLEFPNRFHHTELHTGLPSVEWLPEGLRDGVLRLLASRYSPVSPARRGYYEEIRQTLKPMSTRLIRKYLKQVGGSRARVLEVHRPAPGYRRLVVGC
jgi:SAM-dependent methyltransferase